jgi:hypothetical protein
VNLGKGSFIIIMGIWSLVSTLGAHVSSALQFQESEDVRLERKIAQSSKRWYPPIRNQTTVDDYSQS